MFYVGTVWHGGGANRTDERRLGVILEYCASWVRAQENHITAIGEDVMRTLDPRLQELLGYNIFPPFLGYVDGRHPRRTLMGEHDPLRDARYFVMKPTRICDDLGLDLGVRRRRRRRGSRRPGPRADRTGPSSRCSVPM